MLKQLSIFAQNEKGAMSKITGILSEQNINILGSVTNDSAEYGIVRMVVSDPELAYASLSEHGYQCRLSDIIGVATKDETGSLHKLLLAIEESNINVNYLYLSFDRENSTPILLLSTDDISEVESCLASQGFIVM